MPLKTRLEFKILNSSSQIMYTSTEPKIIPMHLTGGPRPRYPPLLLYFCQTAVVGRITRLTCVISIWNSSATGGCPFRRKYFNKRGLTVVMSGSFQLNRHMAINRTRRFRYFVYSTVPQVLGGQITDKKRENGCTVEVTECFPSSDYLPI